MTTAHRLACQFHAARRAAHYGMDLTPADLERLAELLDRFRPFYEVAGITRYRIRMRRGDQRLCLVYDTELQVIVTVYPARARFSLPCGGRRPRPRWNARAWLEQSLADDTSPMARRADA